MGDFFNITKSFRGLLLVMGVFAVVLVMPVSAHAEESQPAPEPQSGSQESAPTPAPVVEPEAEAEPESQDPEPVEQEEPLFFEANDLGSSPGQAAQNFSSAMMPDYGKKVRPTAFSEQDSFTGSYVNEGTGAAQISWDIVVPPGRNGMEPQLTLTYSSHNVLEASPFGNGWELNPGRIYRARTGDMYGTLAKYIADIPGVVQGELVEVSPGEFYLKTESPGGYARLRFANNAWTVDTPNGIRHELGTTASSRLAEAATGQAAGKTFAWHLEKSTDQFGSSVEYAYEQRTGTMYPQTIRYGALPTTAGGPNSSTHPFEVSFRLEVRTDSRSSHEKGFASTIDRRVQGIDVKVNGVVRYQYALQYLTSALNTWSGIRQMTVTGINPASSSTVSQQRRVSYYNQESGQTGPFFEKLNLPKEIQLSTGAKILYKSYLPSIKFLDAQHRPENTRPHFPLIVVTELELHDIFGQVTSTRYRFTEGGYFAPLNRPVDRKLSWFGKVTKTENLSRQTVSRYYQAKAADAHDHESLLGQLYSQTVTDLSAATPQLMKQSYVRWNHVVLPGIARFFTAPEYQVEAVYPGPAASAVSFVYDSSTGLQTGQTQELDVTFDATTGAFTDMSASDDVVEQTEYAENTSEYLYSFPKRTAVLDSAGQKQQETRYYYDSSTVLGSVSNGSLTKAEQWLSTGDRYLASTATYNTSGQLLTQTNPRQFTTTLTYDSSSLYPATVTNALSHAQSFEYDFASGQLTKLIDANLAETRTSYDGFGRPLSVSVSDPDNAAQLMTVQTAEYTDSQYPNPDYSVQRAFFTATDERMTVSFFDGFHRPIRARTELDDKMVESDVSYDLFGRQVKVTLPREFSGTMTAFGSLNPTAEGTTTSYDHLDRPLVQSNLIGATSTSYLGRELTTIDPEQKQKKFVTDARGQLARVEELNEGQTYVTQYAYDTLGRLSKITNAENGIRDFSYNSLFLESQTDLYSDGDTSYGTIRYLEYDDNGNLLRKRDASAVETVFTYDALNRPLTVDDQSRAGVEVTNAYDSGANANGRLTSAAEEDTAADVTISFQQVYDRLGRVIQATQSLRRQAQTDSYATGFSYDRQGQLSQRTDPDGKITLFQRPLNGQLERITRDGVELVKRMDYHVSGALSRIDLGNNLSTVKTHSLSEFYRLKEVTTQPTASLVTFFEPQATAQRVLVAQLNYLDLMAGLIPSAHAQDLEEELPPFEGGPVFDTIIQQKQNGRRPAGGPAPRQLPGSIQQPITQPSSGVIQQLSFTYDRANNVAALSESADTANKLTSAFTYDDLHRLKTATATTTSQGRTGYSHLFTYSPTGSILSKSDRGTYAYAGASPTSAQPANPQAVTEVTDTQGVVQHFEYDAKGNLIRDGRYVHEWDYLNRLTKTTDTQTGTTVENMYLGMKRVTKTVTRSGAASETTIFIGDTYEVLPNGDTRTNIYADLGGSQPLHVATVENKSGTETINYIHSDHLGSSGLVTDQNGDIVELTSYFPYGEVRHDITSTDFDERHEFTGYEKDDETGLNYANARYYQSDIGKFISQDPFLKRMGDLMSVLSDPQALNSYSYAGNNPVKNTDTTGEVAAEAAASLGWLPFMDGPIPIGDIIYAAAVGTALGIDAYVWVTGSGGKDYSLSSPSPTATPNDNYRDAIMRMSEAGTAGASGASMSGNVGSGGPEDLNPWKDGHKKIDIAQKRISNTINDLNRPGGKIGDGSTAAAVRHQIKTGEMVGRRDHVLKAYNSIRGLNNHIKTLSQYGDKFKLVIRRAQREINKLNRALKTKPRK